jgi:hypothetical protein
MQTGRIVQAVILMMIVALAASCATSKEYTSKLFAPRTPVIKDSQVIALRFLNTDSADTEKEGWVSTDIIMGRDTASNTKALDKLAKTLPVTALVDTTIKNEQAKTAPVIAKAKTTPAESEPVAKVIKPGEVRSKRTRD